MSAHQDTRTLEMEVENTGFMLDRLGQDCAPLQYLRELTQNSIEAILNRPDPSGDIVWDADWNRYELTSIYKLACIDTGTGMTGEEQGQIVVLSRTPSVRVGCRGFEPLQPLLFVFLAPIGRR